MENEIIRRNKELLKKYPFLMPRNIWNGEVPKEYDYTFTLLDEMPEGWKKAFGKLMLEELREALLEEGTLNEYYVVEIKEKYGMLQWYHHTASERISDIVDKYSELSRNICFYCGKPDVGYLRTEYIIPICKECYEKNDFFENNYNMVISNAKRMKKNYKKICYDKNKKVKYEMVDMTKTADLIREEYRKQEGGK